MNFGSIQEAGPLGCFSTRIVCLEKSINFKHCGCAQANNSTRSIHRWRAKRNTSCVSSKFSIEDVFARSLNSARAKVVALSRDNCLITKHVCT